MIGAPARTMQYPTVAMLYEVDRCLRYFTSTVLFADKTEAKHVDFDLCALGAHKAQINGQHTHGALKSTRIACDALSLAHLLGRFLSRACNGSHAYGNDGGDDNLYYS